MVCGCGTADEASAEEQSARPLFWQHISVHGVEDELAGARPMDTERLEAVALWGRLQCVNLRDSMCDLARRDAANAAQAAESRGCFAAAAVARFAAGSSGAGDSGPTLVYLVQADSGLSRARRAQGGHADSCQLVAGGGLCAWVCVGFICRREGHSSHIKITERKRQARLPTPTRRHHARRKTQQGQGQGRSAMSTQPHSAALSSEQ
jgi:hypothetical protein